MSNYYFNEKKGRYESIDEAPPLKRGSLQKNQKEVFCAETFEEKSKDATRHHFETRHVKSSPVTRSGVIVSKRGRAGFVVVIGLIIAIVTGILVFLFNSEDNSDSFSENVFNENGPISNEIEQPDYSVKGDYTYLEELEMSREQVLDKLSIDEADDEDTVYYQSKASPDYLDSESTYAYLYFYEEDDVLQDLSIIYQYSGDELLSFNEIAVIIDGEEFVVYVDQEYKYEEEYGEGDDLYHCEYYHNWLSDDIGLGNAINIYDAEKVVISFRHEDFSDTGNETQEGKHYDYELTEEDKLVFREVIDAFQLLHGELLHDFSIDD